MDQITTIATKSGTMFSLYDVRSVRGESAHNHTNVPLLILIRADSISFMQRWKRFRVSIVKRKTSFVFVDVPSVLAQHSLNSVVDEKASPALSGTVRQFRSQQATH